MAEISVCGVTLLPPEKVSAGTFRVLVPVMANDLAPLSRAGQAGDIVELRLDALEPLNEPSICAALCKTREILGPDKPILATIRTAREGGLADITPERYEQLCLAILFSGTADLIDVELSAGERCTSVIRDVARKAGVYTVFSSHDFDKTPSCAEMTERLCRMGAQGADIAKLAVMPHTAADAAALLEATAQAGAAMPGVPLITMSMGNIGAVTRVCGAAFGCCAGFAAAGVTSAPGQPAASLLRTALGNLREMGL